MACIVWDPSPGMTAFLATLEARRSCKVRITRLSDNEFRLERGNSRYGLSSVGSLVRKGHRWFAMTGEHDMDAHLNGDNGYRRRCDAKHALIAFDSGVTGTVYRDGKIFLWPQNRV